jgi:hypothetical protein
VSTLTGLPTPPTLSNDKFADNTNSLDAVFKEAGIVTPPSKLKSELPLGSPVSMKAELSRACPATVLLAEAPTKVEAKAAPDVEKVVAKNVTPTAPTPAALPTLTPTPAPTPVAAKATPAPTPAPSPAAKSAPVPKITPAVAATGCDCCSPPAWAAAQSKNSAPSKEKPRPVVAPKTATPAVIDPKAPRQGCGMCCKDSATPVVAK